MVHGRQFTSFGLRQQRRGPLQPTSGGLPCLLAASQIRSMPAAGNMHQAIHQVSCAPELELWQAADKGPELFIRFRRQRGPFKLRVDLWAATGGDIQPREAHGLNRSSSSSSSSGGGSGTPAVQGTMLRPSRATQVGSQQVYAQPHTGCTQAAHRTSSSCTLGTSRLTG